VYEDNIYCYRMNLVVWLKKSSIGGNKYIEDYGSNDAALGYF
jgi:hypothetical protein